jgi:hypothetical protein
VFVVDETEMQLIMVYGGLLEGWQTSLKLVARGLGNSELSPFGGLSAQILQHGWLGLVEVDWVSMMPTVDHNHEIHGGIAKSA